MADGITEALGISQDFKLITGTNGHSRKLKFLITGGCGYFAFELAKSLCNLGAAVTLLDIHLPGRIEKHLSDHLKFIKGDIQDYESVYKAFHDIDCVFHAASFGMSGVDQLNKDKTERINVGGTRNVIKACQDTGITKLVYTSSYNIVFDGTPIRNGNETFSVQDTSKFVDYYSITKHEADRIVLAANGSPVEGGGILYTCSLRPAGIYGPGERRHIRRIANYIEAGFIIMKIGNAKCDWVHVNNLIQAHLLAVCALSTTSQCIAAGKGYFVSDDDPSRVFDFLKPLFNGLGYQVPRYKCPFVITYSFAFLLEILLYLVQPFLQFEPLMTRNEVLKMEFDHYHTMALARKELGYKPKKYDFADTVDLYLKERKSECPKKSDVDWIWLGTKLTFLVLLLSVLLQVCF
ncbi:unnamed protein product [Clavelina lepadiformis]|uniref:3-beta hydroxysteroid dehydrogenase/isomerase domain-containing protein n=1 Tax=Clavelina lepadiformis TaxID=159417 RepID=A0ABP0FUU1_CLALP